MRIRVHDKASTFYIQRCYRGASPSCGQLHRPEFAAMLAAVEGQWLEVETDHLFDDQFNTVAIPGVSKNGLRIMIDLVAEIQGDVRVGVVKCNWCYGYDTVGDGACDQCGRTDYLRPLNPCFVGGVAPK